MYHPRTRSRVLTTKKVITDLDEARRLADAGLLWYSAGHTMFTDILVHWEPRSVDHTGKHWRFYLLLEE